MDEGHCGLPVDELTALTGKLLDVAESLIETELTLELEAREVVADLLDGRRCVFLAGLYRAEQTIACPSSPAQSRQSSIARQAHNGFGVSFHRFSNPARERVNPGG